jgi:hypothetical protein
MAAHRAAPAILDHVAGALYAGGLAHNAGVDLFAARGQPFTYLHSAVQCGPFFIAGQQKSQVDGRIRLVRDKLFAGHHHRGDGGFHIAAAAAIQIAIAVRGHEGGRGPLVQRAGGHDISVTRKHERLDARCRSQCLALGPQIAHAKMIGAAVDEVTLKAQRLEAGGNDVHAACVVRRNAFTGDELFGKAQGGKRVSHAASLTLEQ